MKINARKKEIAAEIPMTKHAGKIRIKERSCVFQYGLPFASRSRKFHQRNYVEWQIGYDSPSGKGNLSSLPKIVFTDSKGREKSLYELSEILYYMRRWNLISEKEITSLLRFLRGLKNEELIDRHPACKIKRSHPVEQDINGVRFSRMLLEYPQLVYQFGRYEIIAEITVREKQRAIGVQPMLYFCFPLSELLPRGAPLIGRIAERNETAGFVFNRGNCKITLEMAKIFGILSEPHKTDIIAILETIVRRNT